MAKRPCWSCGKEIFLKDAGETRTFYHPIRIEHLCKDCQRARVRALISKTREGLGLETED